MLHRSSPFFLFNHIVTGIVLISFGASTLYSDAGVRAGNSCARGVAIINALSLILLPLVIISIVGLPGRARLNTTPFLLGGIAITVIGLTMFIPFLWLEDDSSKRNRV